MAKPQAPAESSEFDYAKGEGWRPKEGDIVEGVVVDISIGYSSYKESSYPILSIKDKDGKVVAVHCFQSVLENWVMTNRPPIGSYVGIKFLGKKKKKSGKAGETVSDYVCRIRSGNKNVDPYEGMYGPSPSRQHVEAGETETMPEDEEVPF